MLWPLRLLRREWSPLSENGLINIAAYVPTSPMTCPHWKVATSRKTRILFSIFTTCWRNYSTKETALQFSDWTRLVWDCLSMSGGHFFGDRGVSLELMNLPCTNILLFYMLPEVKDQHRQGMTNHCINQDLKAFCHQHSRIQLCLIPFKQPGMWVHFYSTWWIAEVLPVYVHVKISQGKKKQGEHINN